MKQHKGTYNMNQPKQTNQIDSPEWNQHKLANEKKAIKHNDPKCAATQMDQQS